MIADRAAFRVRRRQQPRQRVVNEAPRLHALLHLRQVVQRVVT
jgi:hypothetical protein